MGAVYFRLEPAHAPGGCTWIVGHACEPGDDGCLLEVIRDTVPVFEDALSVLASCTCPAAVLAYAPDAIPAMRRLFDAQMAPWKSCARCPACWPEYRIPAQSAPARPARQARPATPLTYASARSRYMDTGTILDRDAMLACVTMTEPDLEALGRDWEPRPDKAARPLPSAARRYPAMALSAGAGALSLLNGLVLGNSFAVFLAVAAMLVASVALFPSWRSFSRTARR